MRIVIGLLLSSALSACAVGPNYVRPSLNTPPAFMGAAAVRDRSPMPDLQQAWWRSFQDPVLTHLVEEALDQNLDLAQAAARATQARAGLRGATAALLPSGGVSGAANHARASQETPMGRLLSARPDFQRDGEFYEGDLVGAWEIDLVGGLRRSREAAVAEYEAADAGLAAARLTVAAQTADTYLVARGLQRRIAIAREQVETQQRLATLVALQHRKGVAAELQVRQSEGALAQARSAVPVLEVGLDAALNALDLLLGAAPGTHRGALAATASIPDAPGVDTATAPADLIRRRPDLRVAERRLAAANARIGAATAQYYPKVSLAGLIGSATTDSDGFLGGGAQQGQIGLGLRWRLFDFGRVSAEVALAKGREAEALAAYRTSVLHAMEDVENAFFGLVRREAQARALAGGEQSLARAREASLAAYRGGAVSLIEVLDADARLHAARDARAVAQTEAARAAVASFRALGGGWIDDPSTSAALRVELGSAPAT